MKTNVADSKQVKLSCRNVWKVYGSEPDKFFNKANGQVSDSATHADTIREQQHIVANANVSFDVHAGEIFVIMGLSGSGKSTIVRCLSRLVEPTAGEIILDGEDLLGKSAEELIDIRRHKMGMVFQSFGLMPHLTVIDNIAFPLKLQGKPEQERYAQAQRVIELVGLEGRENNYPKQLSGGQQQRVGIARSLAVEPDIWFLDEPFSALDPLIRKQMQDEFLKLQDILKKTIVFITHDFEEAIRLADRIAIMKDGAVEQCATPGEIVMNPATEYVRKFTEDIDKARVVTVGALARASAHTAAADGNALDSEATIQGLARQLINDTRAFMPVQDKGGALLGTIKRQDALDLLLGAEG